MITVASKLFVEESAQVDDRFMVKSKLLDALRVSKSQYILTRTEYLATFFAPGKLSSLIDIAEFHCNGTSYLPGLW